MSPVKFIEANCYFGPPPDLTSEQVQVIHAWRGESASGSVDGAPMVVTAWQPSEAELADLAAGAPVYLTAMGILQPHFLSTSFATATNPA